MYVDARDNYSETELKNRASVCEQQQQFDAPWSGGQARQGRERQPSVAAPNIYKWLCTKEWRYAARGCGQQIEGHESFLVTSDLDTGRAVFKHGPTWALARGGNF